jgi:hypothetical protein
MSPSRADDDALREQEGAARRRYYAVVAAARESLRRAEGRFSEAAAAIDVHMQMARAAFAGRGRESGGQRAGATGVDP